MALGSFGLTSEAALAAKNDAYAQKKAECKQDAKGTLRHGAFSLPE
jgi:hypothetical protein